VRMRQKPPAVSVSTSASFAGSLRRSGLSIIAEIKRRSPSKGDLARNIDAVQIARAYADGGAAAISCLTDREFFGAREEDFAQVLTAGLPVLRKDFLIDELQIDESVHLGASAVLLIARILPLGRLAGLLQHASRRGLDALVEVHDEAEVERSLEAGASIIGVNNRNLSTLEVDPDRARRLRPRIPPGVVAVAESGVRNREDVTRIEDAGFDAVLIGEALVTSSDPRATLIELSGRVTEVLS
jgi:indole-3-glycerol phosphate synthase